MLQPDKINNYVVVGGGTAGWISAAILARSTEHLDTNIVLVESPDIATVGVGEATIPSMVDLLDFLGIAQKDFIRKTNATFKLAIKFVDWLKEGHSYWHPFGRIGKKVDGVDFYQQWLKYQSAGNKPDYADFSPAVAMAKRGKFVIANANAASQLKDATYAFHFDATLVADYLKNYCLEKGVKHHSANVFGATRGSNGHLNSLLLQDGSRLEGEFFFDCTGQRALLIEGELGVKYQDWSHQLPVNRAVVVQTENAGALPAYTESIAHKHGWRWRIPLQNRTGNGYVYSADYCSEEQAVTLLRENVKGAMLGEPRTLRFVTGKRAVMWEKNCVAVGLSSGFLEPLESTSIYLAMKAVFNFVELMPDREINPGVVNEFNRLMDIEFECIRDFIIAHYSLSKRVDSAFWRDWQRRTLPDSLRHKLALFSASGYLKKEPLDLFAAESWYAVLEGMALRPRSYASRVDASRAEQVSQMFDARMEALESEVARAPSHEGFLEWLRG